MSARRRPGRFAAAALALLLLPPILAVLLLRILPPPTTMFMLTAVHRPVQYDWVDWAHIAPAAALAVIAAEDQRFPEHHGFDYAAMRAAFEHNAHSAHLRGASTISQQTAKNLFLWRRRSYLRKGLEAGLTVLLESLWPKRRILETYLNVAQFGADVYGVEAAARRYFGVPAARLSAHQAALLAAVLPAPERLHAERPSAYVQARAAEIETQMRQLGDGPLRALR